MLAAWISAALVAVIAVVAIGSLAAARAFHGVFVRRAEGAVAAAGLQGDPAVTEDDLLGIPEPIQRWLRWSGALGRRRVSVLRMVHGGRFKAGPTRPWMPIHGEYVVTTRAPSFHWYGDMTLAPGLHAAAIDSYLAGEGRMQVKALSAITVVDARDAETARSAFGRCVAELCMTPTFFLDRDRVRWEAVDRSHARCEVRDGRLSTTAEVFVHDDGALDRIEVMRAFDRGGGRFTMERFTGTASRPATWDGRRLAGRFDGSWNLPEGDLHYVAFDVERASFE